MHEGRRDKGPSNSSEANLSFDLALAMSKPTTAHLGTSATWGLQFYRISFMRYVRRYFRKPIRRETQSTS